MVELDHEEDTKNEEAPEDNEDAGANQNKNCLTKPEVVNNLLFYYE